MLLEQLKPLTTALLVVIFSLPTNAATSQQKAKQLGRSLTPFGAVKAGNKAGTIPSWTGGIVTPPKSYAGGGNYHIDPFADEVPLFTINSKNATKYEKHLTSGQKALLKAYPETFHLPVYRSHRTHSAPDWVYKNTLKNATTASLVSDGNGVKDAYGGIPFPIASNGLEAIWNHMLRWRGEYYIARTAETSVQRNGNFSLIEANIEVLFNYYTAGSNDKLDNTIFYLVAFTKSPARLAGGAVLIHETLNQSRDHGGEARASWGYNSGQRRVRRAPSLAFDSPIPEANGLHTADDFDMYNGATSRFNWRLKEKKEVFIPYNNYRLGDGDLKYKDILQIGHINPEYTRYELHRVWVVEATLKSDKRHIYSKRTFYIDEDSWSIILAENYNELGELWRVNMSYTKNYYELPATFPVLDVFQDLLDRRYHVRGLDNERGETYNFANSFPPRRYFRPAALRRRGHR